MEHILKNIVTLLAFAFIHNSANAMQLQYVKRWRQVIGNPQKQSLLRCYNDSFNKLPVKFLENNKDTKAVVVDTGVPAMELEREIETVIEIGNQQEAWLNIPEVIAEVTAAHDRYEEALQENDISVLDELFWNSELTLRYGITENSNSYDEIVAFRAKRKPPGPRKVLRIRITTFGRDFATSNIEFERGNQLARQSQTLVRMKEGWRIVCAHVSKKSPE
jgi:AtzH-like